MDGPRTGRLAAWAAALALLDQGTKAAVRAALAPGARVPLLGDWIGVVHAPNVRGVSVWVPELPAWGYLFLTLALCVILLGALPLHRFHALRTGGSPWATVAAVLLTAAPAGHLADGLFVPYTTDWIQVVGPWAFNVADLCAWAGLAALAVEYRRRRGMHRELGVRGRWARALETRRAFLRFLWNGMR